MLPPRALFLGSYPPRECGIATFTKDVVDSYNRAFSFSSPGHRDRRARRRHAPLSARSRRDGSRRKSATAMPRRPSSSTRIPSISSTCSTSTGSSAASAASGSSISFARVRKAGRPDDAHGVARSRRDVSARNARALRERHQGGLALRNGPRFARKRLRHRSGRCSQVIHHGVPDVPFQDTDAAKASFGIGQRPSSRRSD